MCGKERVYKSFSFACVAGKGVRGANFGSVARKGVRRFGAWDGGARREAMITRKQHTPL
jgi:hypothetical protein